MVPFHSFLMPELIYCCACMIYHSMLFLWAYKNYLDWRLREINVRNLIIILLLWRALREGSLTILSREIPLGTYKDFIRSLGKSLSSETFDLKSQNKYWYRFGVLTTAGKQGKTVQFSKNWGCLCTYSKKTSYFSVLPLFTYFKF